MSSPSIQRMPITIKVAEQPQDASQDDQSSSSNNQGGLAQTFSRVARFVQRNLKFVIPASIVVLVLLSLLGYFVYTEYAPSEYGLHHGGAATPNGAHGTTQMTRTASPTLLTAVKHNPFMTVGVVTGLIVLTALVCLMIFWPKLLTELRFELPGDRHMIVRDIDPSCTFGELRKIIKAQLRDDLAVEDRDLANTWGFWMKSGDKIVEMSDSAKVSDYIHGNRITGVFKEQERLEFVGPTHYVNVNDFTSWTPEHPSSIRRVPAISSTTYQDVLNRVFAGNPGRMSNISIEGVRSVRAVVSDDHLMPYDRQFKGDATSAFDRVRTFPSTICITHPDGKVFTFKNPMDYRESVEVYLQDLRKVTVGDVLKTAGKVPEGQGLEYSGVMVDDKGNELNSDAPISAVKTIDPNQILVEFQVDDKTKSMAMSYAPHTTFDQFKTRVLKGLQKNGLKLSEKASVSFTDAEDAALSSSNLTSMFERGRLQQFEEFFHGRSNKIKVVLN